MEKKYRTIRVLEQTAKDLEKIAAQLTIKRGEKAEMKDAAQYAVKVALLKVDRTQTQTRAE